MIRSSGLGALSLAAILVLTACASTDRPSVVPDQVVLPTPLESFDASLARTLAAVDAALRASGERLGVPTAAYRPSEPEPLLQTPRALRRVELADPDDGFVVIYQADGRGAAIDLAAALAAYLESGFGQTNYAADTQFAVSTLDDTIVFTTWSRRRSADPGRAEAAFEAVASVGEAVAIDK